MMKSKKAETRITLFIIGLVLVSTFAAVFGIYLADLQDTYGFTYDNDSIEVYNQLESLTNLTEEIRDNTEDVGTKSGVVDILGDLFNSGYTAFLVTKQSFATFDVMIESAASQSMLGETGPIFKNAFTLIVLVLIFVGIILAAIIKRNL